MKKKQSHNKWLILFFFSIICLSATAHSQVPSTGSAPQLQTLEISVKKDKAAGKMQEKGSQLIYNAAAGEDTAGIRKKYEGLIKKSGKPYTFGFGVSKIPTANTQVITSNRINTVVVSKTPNTNRNINTNTQLPARNIAIAAHSISGVNPEKAPGGAEVIISGNKFGNNAADVEVKVNGKAAIIRGISDDQIQIVVPIKAGSGPISVKVKNETAMGPYFHYQWRATVNLFAGRVSNHSSVDGAATNARFDHPDFMCIDRYDNIYVRRGLGSIRIVNKFAEVSTLTGEPNSEIRTLLSKPITTVTDTRGNKYELAPATGMTSTHKTGSTYIKKITPSGRTSILAGSDRYRDGGADGYGDAAVFGDLQAITIDAAGNLYVTETDGLELMNHGDRVRMISPEGRVTTLAGGGTDRIGKRGSADGTGTEALFFIPSGIVVDSKGNLFVAETGNGVIRKITLE